MHQDPGSLTCPIPAQEPTAPPRQPLMMLAMRFVLELVAFGAIAYAGWRIGNGGLTGGILASGLALIAMAAWGAFTVPGDPARNPTPVIVVPGWVRIVVELAVFGGAAWALWVYGSRAVSETFLTAIGIVFIIGWDRLWWLIHQR